MQDPTGGEKPYSFCALAAKRRGSNRPVNILSVGFGVLGVLRGFGPYVLNPDTPEKKCRTVEP